MRTRILASGLLSLWCCGTASEAPSTDAAADAGLILPDGGAGDQGVTLEADAGTGADASVDGGLSEADGGQAAEDATVASDAAAPPGFDADRWKSSVIYFLLTDRFYDGDPSNNGDASCYDPASPLRFHGGDFRGLERRLDYLAELGVDTVWITPITEQVPRRGESCGYHGYWANLDDPDPRRLDPHLGSAADLEALLTALHARGMKLVLDMVVNHAGRGARLVTTHPDWFHPEQGCGALGPADVYCPLSGLPDFALERAEVARYMDELSRSWVSAFAIDGIRMDTVKHVPLEYFRDHFVPTVLGARPGLYLLGEIYDEGSYDLQLRYRGAGFHGFFDFPLRRAIIDSIAHAGSLNAVADRVKEAVNRLGIEGALLRSTFIDNHDVPRFLTELPGGLDADERQRRMTLALATLLTSPGIPQLTYGTELGMSGNYPQNRADLPPWAFDPATRAAAHPELPDAARRFSLLQTLIAARRRIPALRLGGYSELWRPGGGASNVWAFYRGYDHQSRAIVVMNGGDRPVNALHLPLRRNTGIDAVDQAALASGAPLVEALGLAPTATVAITGGEIVVSMPPRSVAVWTLQ